MLNTVIRVNFIEKVTFKKRSGVGKRIALWVSERTAFQKESTGPTVSVCLEFSRNSKGPDVAGLESGEGEAGGLRITTGLEQVL